MQLAFYPWKDWVFGHNWFFSFIIQKSIDGKLKLRVLYGGLCNVILSKSFKIINFFQFFFKILDKKRGGNSRGCSKMRVYAGKMAYSLWKEYCFWYRWKVQRKINKSLFVHLHKILTFKAIFEAPKLFFFHFLLKTSLPTRASPLFP